jgi:tyrosyl-tRNA synthetase
LGAAAFGLTHPLITRADGEKMGKSVGGAVWLDAARTPPYQFHQFWVQLDDVLVPTYLRMLSLRPLDEVEALIAEQGSAPERRPGQRALADEMTTMVHGAAATAVAREAAAILFGGDPLEASVDTIAALAAEVGSTVVPSSALGDAVELLVHTGLAASKSDARRLLQQGSVRANGQVAGAEGGLEAAGRLHERYVLLRKGKRSHHVVEISSAAG